LVELKRIIPNLIICVNSYCHARGSGNLSSIIPDQFIDCRVVTAHRTGVGANVSAIKALCTADPVVAHIHDSAEALKRSIELEISRHLASLSQERVAELHGTGLTRYLSASDQLRALDHLIEEFDE